MYHYNCIVSVRNSVLDERGQTFQEFIANNTVLANYIPDPLMQNSFEVNRMPEVVDIIADNVASCISEQYNTFLRWPFSLTFPSNSTSLRNCFRNSTPDVLNKVAFRLIQIGNPQTDVNQAYMPTNNTIALLNSTTKAGNLRRGVVLPPRGVACIRRRRLSIHGCAAQISFSLHSSTNLALTFAHSRL